MLHVLATVCVIMLGLSRALSLSADQTRIVSYDEGRRLVWARLYPHGGTTLYCGTPFTRRDATLNVEHVYPASWMTQALGCGSREQCRRTNRRFNRMEADLHNLHPDLQVTNQARSDYRFALLPGETPTVLQTCDFEHDNEQQLAEPRPEVRGDIARALLYMEHEYV